MKKKFLILTLCFTLFFTSINYKKSYADGGLISLPILATVSSLAIATGITLSSNDDLYDIGRLFYDYIDSHNKLTWATVQTVFSSSVVLNSNKLVSVKSDFLDIVKGFFDDIFSDKLEYNQIGIVKDFGYPSKYTLTGEDIYRGSYKITNTLDGVINVYKENSLGEYYRVGGYSIGSSFLQWFTIGLDNLGSPCLIIQATYGPTYIKLTSSSVVSIPYSGGYTWDDLESKKENESISLPIPGDLSSLVGQGSKDFWDNTDNLIGTGGITIPGVDSPSIPVDDTITFPNVGDIPSDTPSDTPFANITEYIIGLVVPSDTYWTDTFGGLHNNFISSFPMVDMSAFDSLSVNGKPFPNIDVKIMGSNGRVVNGDTVNSIVNWLRPIISGFVFLCLMFFNYRKIYKLIRNSEPFEGIGKVENHAN